MAISKAISKSGRYDACLYHVRISPEAGKNLDKVVELISQQQATKIKPRQALEMIISKELKALSLEFARECMRN